MIPRVAWASVEGSRRTRELPLDFVKALDSPQRIEDFWLNARPDPVDFRDRIYVPGLVEIAPYLDPQSTPPEFIRDQGAEGSCTGQALAAAIDIQNLKRRRFLNDRLIQSKIDQLVPERVSSRMLYEMARVYDEYSDDGLPGSSIRGAIKGFFHNGVCNEQIAPYYPSEPGWRLTSEMGKDARCTSLGAYFRVRHVLYDYHAALNEAGAILVSSMVHRGWNTAEGGRIPLPKEPELLGAHAFAIVGYDPEGFLIQNSWGPNWNADGRYGPGIGHWLYEDWKKHVLDAWVLRLAVPSENTFHLVGGYQRALAGSDARSSAAVSVPRIQVTGHYVHLQNGRLVRSGNYWNDLKTVEETASLLPEVGPVGKGYYDHLLFYAHGGLNDLDEAVARAAIMTPVLKALKIYPVFFLWRTGFLEELRDVLSGREARVASRFRELSDLSDIVLETFARAFVRPVWSEMKADAIRAFLANPKDKDKSAASSTDLPVAPLGEGWQATKLLMEGANAAGMCIHLVGHSAGAILLGELLQRSFLEQKAPGPRLESISLFAPACTESYFDGLQKQMATALGKNAPDTVVYALTENLERSDSVGGIYRKSLLYLIANALENKSDTPILGLEKVALRAATRHSKVRVFLSGTEASDAKVHGAFDDDPVTLNHLLNRVLGHKAGFITGANGGFARWMFEGATPR